MNNIITASRMNSLLSCPRKHFWSYEVGLRKTDTAGRALRFGSAWARGMDARWAGSSYDDALAIAIPEEIDLDAYACSTIAALLAAYYDYYGQRERAAKIHPEVQFYSDLEGTEFTCSGKMDGLGTLKSGRSALVEAKTTGDSIDPSSDFWLRLRFNIQVLHYISEARKLGWDVAEAIYDVTRKPSIKPREVFSRDADGNKIVVDAEGKRVYSKKWAEVKIGKGKKAKIEKVEVDNLDKPRQSGDETKGWLVKSHIETPDEYGDRLYLDALARPAFYFVRKDIPILDKEVEDFERQRLAMVKMIVHFREHEWNGPQFDDTGNHDRRDPQAWPRHVSCDTCDFCDFKSFCLQNISVDLDSPPGGYEIKPFNPELNTELENTARAPI